MADINSILIQQQIEQIKEILPHLITNIEKFNENNLPLDVDVQKEVKRLDRKLTTISSRLRGYNHD